MPAVGGLQVVQGWKEGELGAFDGGETAVVSGTDRCCVPCRAVPCPGPAARSATCTHKQTELLHSRGDAQQPEEGCVKLTVMR